MAYVVDGCGFQFNVGAILTQAAPVLDGLDGLDVRWSQTIKLGLADADLWVFCSEVGVNCSDWLLQKSSFLESFFAHVFLLGKLN